MNYHSQIIRPPDYPYSECFVEVARAVDEALNVLGAYDPKGTPIVFGAHLEKRLPDKAIIYNTEQIFQWDYIQTLRKHRVWDYSGNNIAKLKTFGIEAGLCPVAYMPSMTVSLPEVSQDIDVLMYGCRNERRQRIYDQLTAAGVNVYFATDVWGEKRNILIARAKIILNVHYYEEAVFEIFRCAHLMANHKCVVSEDGKDIDLEELYWGGMAFARYDQLIDLCLDLLQDNKWIEDIGLRGFNIFRETSMVNSLKDLI